MDTDLTGTAESGKAELTALVGNKHGFDTVKPVQLMKYFIQTFTNPDDIVLDFYSGSGTTGQALIEQNAEDGGTRKAILVQYPQDIAEDSEAWAAGFHTICDIALARLCAVSGKQYGPKQINELCDTGFRVLSVGDSVIKDEYAEPGQYEQASLDLFANNAVEGATDLDLLFQVLPAFRIPYSASIAERALGGKRVLDVNEGQLIACFDTGVGVEAIEAIAKERPLYAVFRDACFAGDSDVANLEELFKTFSPDTIRKVI